MFIWKGLQPSLLAKVMQGMLPAKGTALSSPSSVKDDGKASVAATADKG